MSEYSVYVADDERMIREGIEKLVPWKQLNLKFIGSASDGMGAYEDITKLRPDIVITDIKMPRMDGIELIRRSKEQHEGIHFIVLSGYGEFELATQAMKHGVKHYLLKPCDETEITEVLRDVIREVQGDKVKRDQIENSDKVRILNMKSLEEIHTYIKMDDLTGALAENNPDNKGSGSLINRVLIFIHDHLGNEELSLLWLAQNHYFMNAEHLGRLFRKETGQRFSQYVTALRMEQAKHLLIRQPDMKIYEIAERVGFGMDQQYFGNVFRKSTGLSPLEYRKAKQN
ncbi:response regulator transcription factor [Paenibacillus sinopodophylli]|uniref:response regulator transcription factor n=1 Tax=Paenibacillus sinopodophylli TaxID=1837342 RepID=UPI00110D1ACD|nr:response regulator [Paenibacillus sinopodophylli]